MFFFTYSNINYCFVFFVIRIFHRMRHAFFRILFYFSFVFSLYLQLYFLFIYSICCFFFSPSNAKAEKTKKNSNENDKNENINVAYNKKNFKQIIQKKLKKLFKKNSKNYSNEIQLMLIINKLFEFYLFLNHIFCRFVLFQKHYCLFFFLFIFKIIELYKTQLISRRIYNIYII